MVLFATISVFTSKDIYDDNRALIIGINEYKYIDYLEDTYSFSKKKTKRFKY